MRVYNFCIWVCVQRVIYDGGALVFIIQFIELYPRFVTMHLVSFHSSFHWLRATLLADTTECGGISCLTEQTFYDIWGRRTCELDCENLGGLSDFPFF